MGMIGGGNDAFIGAVHRIAANIDGHIQLVCGAFSSNPQKSKESGEALYLPDERVYSTYAEMIEKESQISTKLDQINADVRPETIDRQVAFAGSLRPEELRDTRRKTLEIEKKNLQILLADIQTVRANLELSVQKADILVQKLRDKLEKEIDDSLADDPKN